MIEEYPEGKDMNRENRKKIASSLMVLLMVLSILTAMLPVVSAENVTIWGRVTDTGGLVDGAEVTLVNVHTLEEYRATTSNGIYEFTQVGEGYYVIRAESDDHYLYKNDTAFRFDGTKNIQKDITLKETPVRDITFYGVIGYETAVTGENITGSYNTTSYTANTQFANIVDGTYSLYWNNTELLNETGNYSIDIQTGHIYIENTSIRSWLNGSNGTLTIDYTYISPVSSAEIQVTAENTIIGRNITGNDGTFSIMVWSYTFNVTVTADGYYTIDKDIYTNGDYTQIKLTEANTIDGFANVNDNGPRPANNIRAYLYNSTSKTVYSTHGQQNGSYSFSGVPDGSYLLIVDAEGCIAHTSIVTITGSTTTLGEVTLQRGANETTATTITLADWNNMELKKSVMLNPDGGIKALGNDVSNIWLQIDMKFGNGDAKINQTEINASADWYNSIGPEFVTTAGFFAVNGTNYVSDANLTNYAVTIEPSVVGEINVTDMGGIWINTTVLYTSAANIGEQEDYSAELMAAQDTVGTDTIDNTYEIFLPSGFELVDNTSANSVVTGYTTISIDPATGSGTDTVSMTFEKSEAPVVRAGLKASDSIYTVSEEGNISYYIVKAGAEITFTSTGTEDPNGNPVTYTWDFGDSTTAETTIEKEINHTFAASNDDITVEMTARDAGGLSNSTTLTVKVDGTPPVVAATSSISPISGIVYAAQNEQIVFNSSASSDNTDFIRSYFWWFGDGDTALVLAGENQSVIKSFSDVKTYNVRLNVTDVVGNYRNSTVFKVQINDTEGPTISFLLLDDKFANAAGSVKENTTAYFNASETTDNVDVAANLTFVWDFGDGSNATGMNVSHMYTAIGSYDINLTVTDSAGNTNNLVKTVVVRAANRPDLSIVSVKFDPTEFDQGSTGKIMVNITNNGEANATSVTITAYTVDIDGNEKEIGSTTTITINGSAVNQLEVGQIATAEIDWKPGETGNFTIKIVVSTPDEISATATNNVYTDVLSVSPSSMQTIMTWILLFALIIAVLLLVIFKNRLSSIKIGGKKK